VLTSGTLTPLELLTAQLCGGVDALARLRVFQCGHVVPPERVLAVGLGVGPRGRRIRLTHALRDTHEVLDECGGVLVNVCRVSPQGVVAFVPSFDFLEKLRGRCAMVLLWCTFQCRARSRLCKCACQAWGVIDSVGHVMQVYRAPVGTN
jgi:Rad3-related DNA helicase